jgi:hypothetical protein
MTFESAESCLTRENKIPLLVPVAVPGSFFDHQGGWMIGTNSTANQQLRNAIFGAAAAGAFDPAKGFTKLGLLDDRCAPELGDSAKTWLKQAGVKDVDEFTLDCAQFAALPNQTQQAVLQHKNSGVSHVLTVTSASNLQVYLTGAKQLSFKPTYIGGDMYGATQPAQSRNFDPDEYDGTIAYTVQTYGATAAGVPLTPAASRCSQIMAAHGLPGVTDEGKDDPVLWYCDLFGLLRTMASRVPAKSLTRANFVGALSKVGHVQFARTSDGVYDRAGKFTGADSYRKIQWQRGCSCWKVVDATFRPNFS